MITLTPLALGLISGLVTMKPTVTKRIRQHGARKPLTKEQKADAAAYMRNYRKADDVKKKQAAWNKAYRQRNRTAVLAKQKAYNAKRKKNS